MERLVLDVRSARSIRREELGRGPFVGALVGRDRAPDLSGRQTERREPSGQALRVTVLLQLPGITLRILPVLPPILGRVAGVACTPILLPLPELLRVTVTSKLRLVSNLPPAASIRLPALAAHPITVRFSPSSQLRPPLLRVRLVPCTRTLDGELPPVNLLLHQTTGP